MNRRLLSSIVVATQFFSCSYGAQFFKKENGKKIATGALCVLGAYTACRLGEHALRSVFGSPKKSDAGDARAAEIEALRLRLQGYEESRNVMLAEQTKLRQALEDASKKEPADMRAPKSDVLVPPSWDEIDAKIRDALKPQHELDEADAKKIQEALQEQQKLFETQMQNALLQQKQELLEHMEPVVQSRKELALQVAASSERVSSVASQDYAGLCAKFSAMEQQMRALTEHCNGRFGKIDASLPDCMKAHDLLQNKIQQAAQAMAQLSEQYTTRFDKIDASLPNCMNAHGLLQQKIHQTADRMNREVIDRLKVLEDNFISIDARCHEVELIAKQSKLNNTLTQQRNEALEQLIAEYESVRGILEQLSTDVKNSLDGTVGQRLESQMERVKDSTYSLKAALTPENGHEDAAIAQDTSAAAGPGSSGHSSPFPTDDHPLSAMGLGLESCRRFGTPRVPPVPMPPKPAKEITTAGSNGSIVISKDAGLLKNAEPGYSSGLVPDMVKAYAN